MRRMLIVGSAALLALTACAGSGDEERDAVTTTTAEATTTVAGAQRVPTSELTVTLELTGTYERDVVHFIRVENPDGTQVFERSLDADRRLTERLERRDFRLLSFQRVCRAACGSSPTPAELGEPTDLCGVQLPVTKPVTNVLVKVTAHDGCEASVS